jgi:hypothetical protein
MTPVWWMAGSSLGSWLALAMWVGPMVGVALLAGMLGPLAMAIGSWLVTIRTYVRRPERVTAVMAAAFAVKMMFVAAYLAVMLRGLALPPAPFVASFIGYFIALYVIEAIFLKRLFAGSAGGARE